MLNYFILTDKRNATTFFRKFNKSKEKQESFYSCPKCASLWRYHMRWFGTCTFKPVCCAHDFLNSSFSCFLTHDKIKIQFFQRESILHLVSIKKNTLHLKFWKWPGALVSSNDDKSPCGTPTDHSYHWRRTEIWETKGDVAYTGSLHTHTSLAKLVFNRRIYSCWTALPP